MKKESLTKEEYFVEKENDIKKLLGYFELDDLTFDEKIALLLPLVDSGMSTFYADPNLKMPFDLHSKTAIEYHNRVLLVLLKYVMQSNNKLDYLKKTSEQNEKIIELLTKISEKQ